MLIYKHKDMGNFNRDNKSGGDRGPQDFGKRDFGGRNFGGGDHKRFGGGRGFGGRDGVRPMMHKATCSKCGNECEVPFRPTGDRPVFCSNCFKNQGGNAGPSRSGGNNFARPSFEQNNNAIGKSSDQFKVQFEILNSKLDKILKFVNPIITVEAEAAREEAAAKEPKKKAIPAKTKTAPKKEKAKKKK